MRRAYLLCTVTEGKPYPVDWAEDEGGLKSAIDDHCQEFGEWHRQHIHVHVAGSPLPDWIADHLRFRLTYRSCAVAQEILEDAGVAL